MKAVKFFLSLVIFLAPLVKGEKLASLHSLMAAFNLSKLGRTRPGERFSWLFEGKVPGVDPSSKAVTSFLTT